MTISAATSTKKAMVSRRRKNGQPKRRCGVVCSVVALDIAGLPMSEWDRFECHHFGRLVGTQQRQARLVRGEPAHQRRKVPQQVEGYEDQRHAPEVAFENPLQLDLAAVVLQQSVQRLVQLLIEGPLTDHQVGLQVKRKAQRVEVAGADGGPLLIDQRYLA